MEMTQVMYRFWHIAGAVLVVLIITVGSCNIHQQAQVVELVKAGTPALEAGCAFSGVTSATCIARAVK